MIDAIVIGAGMAGLSAARDLIAAGHSTVVLEARDRIGGRVHSVRDFCSEPVEAGAEFIHGRGAATWPEAEAAGLEMRPCPLTRHTMFNLGGATRWLPYVMMDPSVWPSLPILLYIGRFKGPDISAREFLDRHRFKGRARVLAQMVLTAHLPGSIDEVGMQGLLDDNVLELETGLNQRIAQGYDALARFLAKGTEVRHGFLVETIRWRPDSVTVTSIGGVELTARAAVTTLPVGVLESGRIGFEPQLPDGKRWALDHIIAGPVFKMLLRFTDRFWPRWLANLPCGVGPVTLYWPVFYGVRREVAPVLTAYATGPRAAALSKLGENEAVDVVLKDLARHFPKARPDRLLSSYRKVDWTTDPFACGGYTLLRPGGTGARTKLTASDTGALFWAGSATATPGIAATVESAFVSGRRAAAEVCAHLRGKPS